MQLEILCYLYIKYCNIYNIFNRNLEPNCVVTLNIQRPIEINTLKKFLKTLTCYNVFYGVNFTENHWQHWFHIFFTDPNANHYIKNVLNQNATIELKLVKKY